MNLKILGPFLILLIMGCSGCQNIGDWQPLTNEVESEKLGVKYGVPNKDHVLDGLTFWELSPLVMQAPYAFRFINGNLRVWHPEGEQITQHELVVSQCVGLEEEVNNLLLAIADSASIMMTKKPAHSNAIFLGSPTWYRIKYNPPDMLGSITLNNIEFYNAPWIKQAKQVKALIYSCLPHVDL